MSQEDSDLDLSSIAHDMKTPLTGIQMLLHLLDEQKVGPLNKTQEGLVKQALSDCQRLVSTIQRHFESD